MKPKMCLKKSFSKAYRDIQPQVHYSLAELRNLIAQANSCVKCVTCKRSINLMPMHLKDLNASVKEILNSRVTKYEFELGGVILAHKNIKIIPSSISFSDNRSFPLMYIADVFIFTPTVGSILTGVVNKISNPGNVYSVLVHNLFNVAVHTNSSLPLTIGSSTSVKVTQVDFSNRLLYIKAEFCNPDGTDLDVSQLEIDTPDTTTEQMVTKKKKKKKDKNLESLPMRELHSILKNSPVRQSSSSNEPSASSESEALAAAMPEGLKNGRKNKKKKSNKDAEKSRSETDFESKVDSTLKKRKRNSESTDDSDIFLTPPAWSEKKKKKKTKLDEISCIGTPKKKSASKHDASPTNSIFCTVSSTPLTNSSNGDITQSLLQEQLAQIKEELKNCGIENESSPVESKKAVELVSKLVPKLEHSLDKDSTKRKKKKKVNGSQTDSLGDITKQMLQDALLGVKHE